ncbi:MAG: hypothetical protein Q4C47_08830, partial [Planctomycetia bacterium]|nr:hypothetical protein [Planctomycetia bacterium]
MTPVTPVCPLPEGDVRPVVGLKILTTVEKLPEWARSGEVKNRGTPGRTRRNGTGADGTRLTGVKRSVAVVGATITGQEGGDGPDCPGGPVTAPAGTTIVPEVTVTVTGDIVGTPGMAGIRMEGTGADVAIRGTRGEGDRTADTRIVTIVVIGTGTTGEEIGIGAMGMSGAVAMAGVATAVVITV